MLKHLWIYTSVLFFVACSNSKELVSVSDPVNTSYRAASNKEFKLLHTDLELEPDWDNKTLKGRVILSLHPYYYEQDSIVLDAQFMDIFSVQILSDDIDFEYDSIKLKVFLNETVSRNDTIELCIDYQANPEKIKNKGGKAITDAKGLFFISADTAQQWPKHLWTQGETKSSSCWFPTIDEANQKTTQRVAIKVDTGLITVSNGRLKSQKFLGQKRIDIWEQLNPHAPYLFMLFAGDFISTHDYWIKPNGDTLMLAYIMNRKYAPYAKDIFGNTPEMLDFFSKSLGYVYPWAKYHQIVVKDFVSGAMENTSASIFYDGLNSTDIDLIDKDHDDIIAHELIHHWFGDLVTCESWANLPLNEAFATYGEYLWLEYKYSKADADWLLQNYLWDYYAEADIEQKELIRFEYDHQDDMFDAHSYQKGSRVLHLLRHYVGDEAFFESLKRYLHKFAFNTAEIHDLRIIFEEVTGQDLNWFFNQWFLGKGHPIAVANYNKISPNNWELILTQNSKSAQIFKLPFSVDVLLDDSIVKRTFLLEKVKDTFIITSNKNILGLNIDPGKAQLWQLKDNKPDLDWLELLSQPINSIDRYHIYVQLNALQNKGTKFQQAIFNGLFDSAHYIREYVIEQADFRYLYQDPKFVQTISEIVKTDTKSAVRAAGINLLKKINTSVKYPDLEVFIMERMEDSSYLVKSEALHYLAQNNTSKALELAQNYIFTDHLELSYALANLFAKSDALDSKYVDFYIYKINTSYKYYSMSFFYYFSMFIKKKGFQDLAQINRVFDFVIAYQNKHYKKPYTRYMTGQMLSSLKNQYERKLKDLSISAQQRAQIEVNLDKIQAVMKSVRKKT